jgi:HKD family nuclease
MPAGIQATHIRGKQFSSIIGRCVQQNETKALGIAVAYVSIYGFNYVKNIAEKNGIAQVNIISDISDCVTHPNALEGAINSGWGVRVVDVGSTFHPKFYIGCREFGNSDAVVDPSFIIIGSANLSYSGFVKNTECSFVQTGAPLRSCVRTWETLWGMGANATRSSINDYRKRFSERNRKRRLGDLIALGVADRMPEKSGGLPQRKESPPQDALKATSEICASIAWAGLQSFTGDYTLQVEFPQKSAQVLNRILLPFSPGGSANIACSDGVRRDFKFRFYADNGMFRLNIPNDVPNVGWVRAEKTGIAYVELRGDRDVYFEILKPGSALEDVVDHSLALGTWGRTPTRLYGWY